MMTGSRVTLGLPRSAVLYCALLALSCVIPLYADTSNDGHVTVNVKKYFSMANLAFIRGGRYFVSYSNAEDYCRDNGAVLPADQSLAAHKSMHFFIKRAMTTSSTLSYLGGDAVYTSSFSASSGISCVSGNFESSRHCVYRWNKGLFASASADGQGVPFWRGSFRRQGDAISLNGYPSFWGAEYPKRGELYTLLWYKEIDGVTAWYDGKEASGRVSWTSSNPETTCKDYIIVCEVHDSISTTTTSTTTTTSSPTPEAPAAEVTSEPTGTAAAEVEASPSSLWTLRDWHSVVILLLLLGAVVVLLLAVVICCCCRCCSSGDGAKETSPMTLRETVGERVFAVMPMSVVPHRDFHDDSPSAEHYGQMGSSKTL